MKLADRLLLKHGFDLNGNKTGNSVIVLTGRQKRKKCSKPYIQKRKNAKKSPAEERIARFLADNNIPFLSEYWFRGCFNKKNNQLLYFDFYLPEHHAIIEFDGLHHFKPVYGVAKLKSTKINDWIKNKYCKSLKIPLLRISCFDSADIEKIICEWFDKHFS